MIWAKKEEGNLWW